MAENKQLIEQGTSCGIEIEAREVDVIFRQHKKDSIHLDRVHVPKMMEALHNIQRKDIPQTKSVDDILAQFTPTTIVHTHLPLSYSREDVVKAMKEYKSQGHYFTPDDIRKVQEMAYAAGLNAAQE